MALIDVVKYNAPDDSSFVWKYPSEKLKIGTQVIVNQGQEVLFVKGGQALDILGPGTHTLNTGNIPILEKLINLPFGGNTPFTAEVWFINKTVKRDLKWGTQKPIQIFDNTIGFPVSVRSFGKWGVRIDNSRAFVIQITGSQTFTDDQKINDYFTGEILQSLSKIIASAININNISILQITSSLDELSKLSRDMMAKEFERFGLEIVNFNIESINIPEEEMKKIQNVFEKTLEAKELSKVELGAGFSAIKTFEVLNAAASNESEGSGGSVGAMLGAGIGLGAGLPLGSQLGQKMDIQNENKSTDPSQKLKKLKELLDEELITKDQYDIKREEILKDF